MRMHERAYARFTVKANWPPPCLGLADTWPIKFCILVIIYADLHLKGYAEHLTSPIVMFGAVNYYWWLHTWPPAGLAGGIIIILPCAHWRVRPQYKRWKRPVLARARLGSLCLFGPLAYRRFNQGSFPTFLSLFKQFFYHPSEHYQIWLR